MDAARPRRVIIDDSSARLAQRMSWRNAPCNVGNLHRCRQAWLPERHVGAPTNANNASRAKGDVWLIVAGFSASGVLLLAHGLNSIHALNWAICCSKLVFAVAVVGRQVRGIPVAPT